jgi:hypothetical protein
VYLSKLPRFEKKLRVALDWTLDLCFSKDFACIRNTVKHSFAPPSAVHLASAAGAAGSETSEIRVTVAAG